MDLTLLQSHRLLQGIPEAKLLSLVAKCQDVVLEAGQVLLTPGQDNHTLYLVLSGEVQVFLGAVEAGNSFSILPGEVIGEMSIVENRPVAAWVLGAKKCRLLAMPEQVFWDDFLSTRSVMRSLLQLLIGRVRKTDTVLLRELEEKVRYEHLRRELESAGKIQANILPMARPLFPHHPQISAHAVIKPAREVGGDFFDAVAINDHLVCVAVGDVSGKGMPAALFMVRVITLLRMCLLREENPGAILPALNRLLCEANDEFMFVTVSAALVDTRSGHLTFINGGHPAPVLWSNGNQPQVCAPPQGTLLGIEPNAGFEIKETVLQPGDTLLLYSDGVSEAENSRRELFTIERAVGALSRHGHGGDLGGLVGALETALAEFTEGASQSDDITILALRYHGDVGGRNS